jgi:DedD protein
LSDPNEPSYYEIALTGRQVMVAFVVVLVSLLAAFFAGVWVGRDDASDLADVPIQEMDGEIGAAGDGVEELSFFEEAPMEREPDLERVARERNPDTTLREDVEGPSRRAERQEPTRTPAERQPPVGEVRDRSPEPEPDPPARVNPETRPEPRVVQEETPPAREAPRERPATPSTGDLVIQVFVSGEEASAQETLGRLTRAGFRAFISPVVSENRTLYRVRVGPFERRAAAEAEAARIEDRLGLETWITQ